MRPVLRLVEEGQNARPKRLPPSQAFALGAIWARRPGREEAVRRVAALSHSFEVTDLLEAVGAPSYWALALEVGTPRHYLDRRFVYHFVGAAKVFSAPAATQEKLWRPNGWTLAALKAAGCSHLGARNGRRAVASRLDDRRIRGPS